MSLDPAADARPVRGGPQHIPTPPGTTPGPPAPWAAGPVDPARLSRDHIQRSLALGPLPAKSPVEVLTRSASAVLAPLYEHDGDVYVVLTRRAWHLRAHKGEVSFPGGRQEPAENLWQTALREANEEVALDPTTVERLGELDHLSTVTSRSTIVPYVGWVRGGRPELTANDDEVDAILHVSLAELVTPGVYHSERWGWGGIDRTLHFFELVGDTVWGATGSMLVDLLARVTAE